MKKVLANSVVIPLGICCIFLILYSLLAIIRHNHFLTGYDLAIIDQFLWKYSQFKSPITTVHSFYFTSAFEDHIEFIYAFLSPFYWIFNDVRTILFLQVFAICSSGMAVWLLAKERKLPMYLSISLLISYLLFYGIQNALWADVHSLVFAVGFVAWFIFFLEKKSKWTYLFFFLAITSKEDIAQLTLLISFVYFLLRRDKQTLILMLISIAYLLLVFVVYYPHFTRDGYRYARGSNIFHDPNPLYLIDTKDKRDSFLYSLASYGFLPLLSPLQLIPALGDLAKYFILGRDVVSSAQGLFLHYRSSLAILLIWPTILGLAKYKKLQHPALAIYILACALFFQYILHLPLSYLTKPWFWKQPQSVSSIESVITSLPKDASVVSQNNITPHITHRDLIFTLWPEMREFKKDSPCGKKSCAWFHWGGKPEYLIVDTSTNWDPRYFLTTRELFIEGINNFEKKGIVKVVKRNQTATLYKIVKTFDIR